MTTLSNRRSHSNMGVAKFFAFLNKRVPTATTTTDLSSLADASIAIDASILVYAYHSVSTSRKINNLEGAPINHVIALIYFVARLRKHRINPVFVFDGKPPVQKQDTIALRKQRAHSVPHSVFNQTRQVLVALGVPVVQAPSEAEAQAAHMLMSGQVDHVLTKDSDCLLFGASKIITGIVGDVVTMFNYDHALAGIPAVDRETMLKVAILSGTDYNPAQMTLAQSFKLLAKCSLFDPSPLPPPPPAVLELYTNPLVDPNPVIAAQPRLSRLDMQQLLASLHLQPKKIESLLDHTYA